MTYIEPNAVHEDRARRIERQYQAMLRAEEKDALSRMYVARHVGARICIRTLRVLGGACLAYAAFLISSYVVEVFDMPLASLTLGKVVGSLVLGLLSYLIGAGALALAFGRAPTAQDRREALRKRATAYVLRQDGFR